MATNYMNDPRYQYLGGNMGGSPMAAGGMPPGFGGFAPPASVGMMQGRPSMGTSLASAFMSDPQPGMAGGFGAPNPGMPNLNPVSIPNRGGPPQGDGGMGSRLLGGLQGFGGKAMEFMGGNDGANALNLGALLLSAYDANKQNNRYDEEKRRRDEMEDEQRRRYDANAPARAALAGAFQSRIGG